MNVNDINLSKYNLDIIKSISINPNDLSINVPETDDIQYSHSLQSSKVNIKNKTNNKILQINSEPSKLNSSYNSKESNDDGIEEEEKYSTEQNLSESNYSSCINNNNFNISKKYKNIELNDDKDKLILIKKQNDKINELFNLLESRDKEIHTLQNENNSLYKYKNDYKISEQNNISKSNLINEYEQALQIEKQELNNKNNELLQYKNISKDLQNNLNSLNKEYEEIQKVNKQLNKKISYLKKENGELQNKIKLYEEKYSSIKNRYKNLEMQINKLNDFKMKLTDKNYENEQIIMKLQKEKSFLNNEIQIFKESNLSNEKKLIYLQDTNNKIMNEIKEINKKDINLKSNIAEFFEFFSKQIMNLLNKNELYFQNSFFNNGESNSDNLFNKIDYNSTTNFGFDLKSEYSHFLKEIPILSNIEMLYSEIKKYTDSVIHNYEKLKNTYNNKINAINNTLNSNILELNSKLTLEKEHNNLLMNKNELYEINKNISDLNGNNNEISIKFKLLKDFINVFYNNILSNYNEISSKFKPEGKLLLSLKEPKIYEESNSTNDFNNDNNIKEIIIEIEKIFNNLYEYINYLGEELNKLKMTEINNTKLKKEKIELVKNINQLNNEINLAKIDTKTQENNLKIKYDLILKEKIKDLECKNNEGIKILNEQMKKKDEEITNVNKNYNLLYNQYKLIMKNNTISEINN